MAAVILMISVILVSAWLMVGLSRRKRCAYNKGYIIVPYKGDMRELEMTLKCYYFEELFESAEYRRRIIVVYRNDEDECLRLSEKFGYAEIISEDRLAEYLRGTRNGGTGYDQRRG